MKLMQNFGIFSPEMGNFIADTPYICGNTKNYFLVS